MVNAACTCDSDSPRQLPSGIVVWNSTCQVSGIGLRPGCGPARLLAFFVTVPHCGSLGPFTYILALRVVQPASFNLMRAVLCTARSVQAYLNVLEHQLCLVHVEPAGALLFTLILTHNGVEDHREPAHTT